MVVVLRLVRVGGLHLGWAQALSELLLLLLRLLLLLHKLARILLLLLLLLVILLLLLRLETIVVAMRCLSLDHLLLLHGHLHVTRTHELLLL